MPQGELELSQKYKHIFDEILRISDDGFIVVDPDGVVTDINEQYCQYLGKPRSEIVGYPITKTISNSKMVDIVKKGYCDELALHKFMDGDTRDKGDNFLLVTRSCVFNKEHEAVAAVAQVKFRLQTLESAKRLMNEYAELEYYRELYLSSHEHQIGFDHMIGSEPAFLAVRRQGLKAAKTDFPVLVTGETGTGKEIMARAIHNASARAGKPMMSINCAAIPSELLEAELFGYAEGAFTGAKKGGKRGKFQIASGGTLFLDEIGDMPLHMQAKILRALQEQEVDPVGGGEPVKVDVRIISATRQNLSAMIEQGLFREDLYYRLNVVNIEMPPLRERRRDIFELSNFFLTQLNHRYQSSVILSDDVKYCFLNYSWPGNIRELDNVIKAAYAICDGFIIDMTDLPAKMVARQSSEQLSKGGRRLAAALEDYECEIIKSVLQDKNGDCRQAAAELGLHRSVLYKKMAKLNIPTPRRQSAAQKP